MDNFFVGVVRFVSRYALVKVHEQTLVLDDQALCRQHCSGDFSSTLGLPCVHNLPRGSSRAEYSISVTSMLIGTFDV